MDLDKSRCFHGVRNAERRISIKDYRKYKKPRILLFPAPVALRQYWVRMNGLPWPKDRRAVSLTRLLAGVCKALVRAG